jgi:hypothetical protein
MSYAGRTVRDLSLVQKGYSDGEQCWGFCLVWACACQLVSRTRPCCPCGALPSNSPFAYGRHTIYYWIQYKLLFPNYLEHAGASVILESKLTRGRTSRGECLCCSKFHSLAFQVGSFPAHLSSR